jgi:translation elongation factor EF-1alpha
VPISGFVSDNMIGKCSNLSFYSGASLPETLDMLVPLKPPLDRPL